MNPASSGAERIPWRAAEIAPGVRVQRAIPVRTRRTIGAWCFLDLAGPFGPDHGTELDVGPHPHIGLQTVTWLFDGAVRHRDGLGSDVEIRPHELNVMTSGHGLAHSERAPDGYAGGAHVAQLWVALPEDERDRAPSFEHHADLPVVKADSVEATVLVGTFEGATSPATTHTPLLGLDVVAAPGVPSSLSLPLTAAFEHGFVVVEGSATIGGEPLASGELLYLPPGLEELALTSNGGARLMVLGGEPYADPLVMWWNFVAGSREAITTARADWESGSPRFAEVVGDDGPRTPAPPLAWR